MKFITSTTVLAVALMGGVPFAVQAQTSPSTQAAVTSAPGKVAGAATTEVTAKVIAVDAAKRSVTLQSASGKTRTI